MTIVTTCKMTVKTVRLNLKNFIYILWCYEVIKESLPGGRNPPRWGRFKASLHSAISSAQLYSTSQMYEFCFAHSSVVKIIHISLYIYHLSTVLDFSSEKYCGSTGHRNSWYQHRNLQWGCRWWHEGLRVRLSPSKIHILWIAACEPDFRGCLELILLLSFAENWSKIA